MTSANLTQPVERSAAPFGDDDPRMTLGKAVALGTAVIAAVRPDQLAERDAVRRLHRTRPDGPPRDRPAPGRRDGPGRRPVRGAVRERGARRRSRRRLAGRRPRGDGGLERRRHARPGDRPAVGHDDGRRDPRDVRQRGHAAHLGPGRGDRSAAGLGRRGRPAGVGRAGRQAAPGPRPLRRPLRGGRHRAGRRPADRAAGRLQRPPTRLGGRGPPPRPRFGRVQVGVWRRIARTAAGRWRWRPGPRLGVSGTACGAGSPEPWVGRRVSGRGRPRQPSA